MKKILIAASLLTFTLCSEVTYAKNVISECSKKVTNRNFECLPEQPDNPPNCGCPEKAGNCTISIVLYDDLSFDFDLGELSIPNPGPVPGNTAEEIADNIAIRLINGETFVYQP